MVSVVVSLRVHGVVGGLLSLESSGELFVLVAPVMKGDNMLKGDRRRTLAFVMPVTLSGWTTWDTGSFALDL